MFRLLKYRIKSFFGVYAKQIDNEFQVDSEIEYRKDLFKSDIPDVDRQQWLSDWENKRSARLMQWDTEDNRPYRLRYGRKVRGL